MKLLWSVAWRNLWRHRRRSLITAVAMAVAVGLCMATIAITDGMFTIMFEVMVEQQLGHVQVNHPEYPEKRQLYDTMEDVPELLAEVDALPGTVAASARLNGFALIGGREKSAGGQLQGVVPAREAATGPLEERVVQGRYLSDAPAKEIMLGEALAEELEVEVGGEVVVVTQAADGSMGNDLYEIVGLARTGSSAMDRSGAWLHLADLQQLLVLPDQAHQLTLITSDPEAIGPYAEEVREAVGTEDLQVQTWWEASPQTAEMMGMRNVSAAFILGIVFIAAAFGVLNTMMMSVFERTRELGILKAIGLRPGRMVILILLESLFLAGLASAIGLVIGGLLDWYLVVHGLDFSASIPEGFSFSGVTIDPVMRGEVHAPGIAITIGCVFVVSLLASLLPALRAARLRPVEAIRSE